MQIILALGRSKGTPGKNVINFHEKPILAETIQQWVEQQFIQVTLDMATYIALFNLMDAMEVSNLN